MYTCYGKPVSRNVVIQLPECCADLRSSPSKHDEVEEDQRFDPHSNGARPSPDAWLSGDSAGSRDPHSSDSDPQNSNGATSNGNSMGSFFSNNFDFESDPNGGYMADIGSENESPSSIMLARSGELDMHLDGQSSHHHTSTLLVPHILHLIQLVPLILCHSVVLCISFFFSELIQIMRQILGKFSKRQSVDFTQTQY